MTVNDSGTVNLSQAAYDPSTKSYTTTLAISPPARTLHVEAGYDSNGGLVMNIWPTGATSDPDSTDTSNLGYIRFAGGKVTVIDQNGNVIPNILPDSRIAAILPLSFLGSNPGPSVVASLVVPNIQRFSTALNATLQTSGTTALVTANFAQGGTTGWTYAQSGSNWIVQQVVQNVSSSQLSTTRTIQFANMNWNENATKDAARAALGSTVQAPPTAGPFPSDFSWTAPVGPAISPNSTTISPTDCNTHVYNFGGSQNIVFQHGLKSSSCTWTRMANWLNQDFLFGKEVIPSLDATASIATQGQALINEINVAGGGSYILMGHSMGGLVARYAAQDLAQFPGDIAGVASVDTPHEGANSAINLPVIGGVILEGQAVNLWIDSGCYSAYDNWFCYLASTMFFGGGAAQAYYASTPALVDLTPGSQALQSLNSNSENFIKAGVVGYTPQRWLFTRVAWNWVLGMPGVCNPTDSACCPPDNFCGERTVATATEISYDADVAVDSFLLWDIETWCEFNSGGGGDCIIPPDLISLYVQLYKIAIDLDIADDAFDFLVDVPGDGTSDGLVQGPSQFYPSAQALQYPIKDADSHSAALKSPKDRPVLDAVLRTSFHMTPLASCAYSVPTSFTSPETFSMSGGSDSFSVSTSNGCPWSAVSENSWITITSGINGMGNGAVGFTVDTNSEVSSRQGKIQVGNGNNTATFYISQSGPCAYSLSQASVVAIPASGGTATVTVNTQQNCIWSASSNVPWLTISNSSGTGSGSFTWTAAANTGSSGRTALITVGSQTLTIVDGNPAGTPGSATVTINGSPQSFTFHPCPPQYPCNQTIYESGTIAITVDGMTYSVGYGGNTSTGQIASTLATQMNYQYSPVTAVVNGSTITIQASINGSDTDYPLSVSETFNAQCGTYGGTYHCFPGPAFSPSTTVSQLNGGSD